MNKRLTKYSPLALLLLCIFALSSCGKDDEKVVIDEVWKLENEVALIEQAKDPAYTKLQSEANDGYILYKPLVKGTGEPIYFTSQVEMYYKGRLIDGTEFDSHQFTDGTPFKCSVNPQAATQLYKSVIAGWTVALQNMVEGDKWEVWIPQELAYGTQKYGEIPGYSTLIFEIEVVKVIQP